MSVRLTRATRKPSQVDRRRTTEDECGALAVLSAFNRLRERDRRFFDWAVKWTARYVCEEYMRGIMKFSQAMRVRKDALSRIHPSFLPKFQDYLRTNHPGYRNDYVAPEGEDDEDCE